MFYKALANLPKQLCDEKLYSLELSARRVVTVDRH